jgi:hypothetical protein
MKEWSQVEAEVGIVVSDQIFDLESTAENFHPQGPQWTRRL